jgi:hypothetical protein
MPTVETTESANPEIEKYKNQESSESTNPEIEETRL